MIAVLKGLKTGSQGHEAVYCCRPDKKPRKPLYGTLTFGPLDGRKTAFPLHTVMRPMQRALDHAAGAALQLQEKRGLLRKNLDLQRNVFSATSAFAGKDRLNELLQTVVPEAALGKLLPLFLEVEPLACIASIDWQMCLCASRVALRMEFQKTLIFE